MPVLGPRQRQEQRGWGLGRERPVRTAGLQEAGGRPAQQVEAGDGRVRAAWAPGRGESPDGSLSLTLGWAPALLRTRCVTLGKSLTSSGPQCPHLYTGTITALTSGDVMWLK